MKSMIYTHSLWLFFFASTSSFAQPALIPQPQRIVLKKDAPFLFSQPTQIAHTPNNQSLAFEKNALLSFFQSVALKVELAPNARPNAYDISSEKPTILLEISKADTTTLGKAEAYALDISPRLIHIKAPSKAGIWNGIQTVKQLVLLSIVQKDPCTPSASISIPSLSILDFPDFKWRGLMLDVSRHFFTKEEIKRYIEMMSLYKFNVFHWHLADDNGWRIEIKAFPKLTEIGAWRVERHGFFGERKAPTENEPATYGGFYTQEDIKEIVSFAQERNVTIVPEIDVPGHSSALIAAYPELSTTGEKLFVSPGQNFARWFTENGKTKFEMLLDNTLDPANEMVYRFLEKVMKEVAALFPSEYIHMGGDECFHGYWAKSEKTQAFMKKHKIETVEGLQSYFVHRMNKIITKLRKKMIGWDEILEGGDLDKTSAVMSWRGVEGGIAAARSEHQVVMSPTTYAYLDYTQGDPSLETKIYASLSLKKSFEFSPLPDGLNQAFVLGGQANLWTEQVPTLEHAFYMTYPRAFSVAEKTWNLQSPPSWEHFFSKVERQFQVFDYLETSISKATYDPIIETFRNADTTLLYLNATTDIPQGDISIRYTTDNTFPTLHSPTFKEKISLPEGDYRVRLQTYKGKTAIGRMLSIDRKELIRRAKMITP